MSVLVKFVHQVVKIVDFGFKALQWYTVTRKIYVYSTDLSRM